MLPMRTISPRTIVPMTILVFSADAIADLDDGKDVRLVVLEA
jgi:hypothetical protein